MEAVEKVSERSKANKITVRTATSYARTLLISVVAPLCSTRSAWLRGPRSEAYSSSVCPGVTVKPQPAHGGGRMKWLRCRNRPCR